MNDYVLSRQFATYLGTHVNLTLYGVLRDLFEKAWCKETALPDCQAAWTRANPEQGQSAVTALAVHVLCGGTLLRTVVSGFGPHYYNHLTTGESHSVLDLTRSQFPLHVRKAIQPGASVERYFVLESPDEIKERTQERYVLLRDRLAEAMRKG